MSLIAHTIKKMKLNKIKSSPSLLYRTLFWSVYILSNLYHVDSTIVNLKKIKNKTGSHSLGCFSDMAG